MNALTPREQQVVELLWDGHGDESIASQLEIANDTVRRHMTNMRAKTRTTSRLDLAMKTFKEAHKYERKEA